MSVIDAVGEKTIRLFQNRKFIVLLLLIAVVGGFVKFSDGLNLNPFQKDFEKMTYQEHLDAAADELGTTKKLNLWDKAVEAEEQGNYAVAESYLVEFKKHLENAKAHELAAANATDDPGKKKFAEYNAESTRYMILKIEKNIEQIRYEAQGNHEAELKAKNEAHEYFLKANEWAEKADEIKLGVDNV
ncbi:MAG: hypothetical protein D6733_04485 [Methanobacteriota archaeon]|nr:MAG: hypothetical protein D6733_04485 [Euryarchaeota archaeon]